MSKRLNNLSQLRTFRKASRSSLTSAKAKLWTLLKQSQLDGRKFRRQHSIGRYILDFYCPAERLAIELDGAVHDTHEAQEYDRERDLFLNNHGIKVLRFENKLVFEQAGAVTMAIKGQFGSTKPRPPVPTASHQPPRQALPATPPSKGGEL